MAKETKRFAYTVDVTYSIPVEVKADTIEEAKRKLLDMWLWGQIQPDMECDQVTNVCATPEGHRPGDTMEHVLLMPDFRNYRREGIWGTRG